MVDDEDGSGWLKRELGNTGKPKRSDKKGESATGLASGESRIKGQKPAHRILVVEDDPLMNNLYQAILGDKYELHILTTGEEAMDAIEHFRPELIILDHELPGMSGMDVCRRVREKNHLDSVKVVMVSGQSTLSDRIEGFRAGADDFLIKPVDLAMFREKIEANFQWNREVVVRQGPSSGKDLASDLNCWEYRQCGRKDCPAYLQKAGRLCWLVAGTMCGGRVSGSRAQKLKNCSECDFFIMIRSSGKR